MKNQQSDPQTGPRRIIIVDGTNSPQFEGQWMVGEVLAMAEKLALWAQSLQVPVQAAEPQPVEK